MITPSTTPPSSLTLFTPTPIPHPKRGRGCSSFGFPSSVSLGPVGNPGRGASVGCLERIRGARRKSKNKQDEPFPSPADLWRAARVVWGRCLGILRKPHGKSRPVGWRRFFGAACCHPKLEHSTVNLPFPLRGTSWAGRSHLGAFSPTLDSQRSPRPYL